MNFLRQAADSQTDACIIAPFTPSNRYAYVNVERRPKLAHRLVLELGGGQIDGLEVRHLCGTARCVNPRHLQVGTHAENEADKRLHGTVRLGESHPGAKLTDDNVRMIRASSLPTKELARRLGVAPLTVRSVRLGRSWTHV